MNDNNRINAEKPPTYGAQEVNSDTDNIPTWHFWKKRRYVVAILAFFGFFNVYALRVNLSIAIVAMTENKTIDGVIEGPDFDWDPQMKGLLLSSFFYGYIVTQIPGGWLATKFGGNRLFGLGIAATAFLTLLTPPAANINVYLLLFIRIIEGLFEGVTYPCIHAVWSRWAPPLERSRLATLAFSGSYAGTVFAMPVCGIIAKYLGWEWIFYIFGAMGLAWYGIWSMIVKESPSLDPRISKAELKYIKDSLGSLSDHDRKLVHPPWKSIVTSAPVWAIVASHFSENWGFYTLLTQLPLFMTDVYGFNLAKTGFLSAIPYLVMAILIQVAGYLADMCQERGYMTTTQVRKTFNCGAFIAQTVFMFGAAYSQTSVQCMTCLTLAVGLGAFAWSGFSVNHLDIAPQYASVLMGFSNTFATLPGILSPIISGAIVPQHAQKDDWRVVFFIASAIYLAGCILYGIFASGKLQPWANIDPSPDSQPPKYSDTIVRELQGHDNMVFETDETTH